MSLENYGKSLPDFDNINMCLQNVDWDALLTGDVNEQWLNWKSCFLHIIDQCIPHSNIIPSNRLPWINNTVIFHDLVGFWKIVAPEQVPSLTYSLDD